MTSGFSYVGVETKAVVTLRPLLNNGRGDIRAVVISGLW